MNRPQGATDRMAVASVFVDVAETLAGSFAVTDLAQRLVDGAVEILDVWAAGLLVADPDPALAARVLAASTHEAELLELVQVRSGQGPCLAAMEREAVVAVEDLAEVEEEWPVWVAGARDLGVRRVYGIPLRREGRTIGALNLFRADDRPLGEEDLALAVALADVATIGILTHHALHEAVNVQGQLQHALESRVVVEQAKGRLAEREQITVAEAFTLLRTHARATSQPLSEVARAVVEGSLDLPA